MPEAAPGCAGQSMDTAAPATSVGTASSSRRRSAAVTVAIARECLIWQSRSPGEVYVERKQGNQPARGTAGAGAGRRQQHRSTSMRPIVIWMAGRAAAGAAVAWRRSPRLGSSYGRGRIADRRAVRFAAGRVPDSTQHPRRGGREGAPSLQEGADPALEAEALGGRSNACWIPAPARSAKGGVGFIVGGRGGGAGAITGESHYHRPSSIGPEGCSCDSGAVFAGSGSLRPAAGAESLPAGVAPSAPAAGLRLAHPSRTARLSPESEGEASAKGHHARPPTPRGAVTFVTFACLTEGRY